MRTTRLFTAALLAATGLTVVGATTESAHADSRDLRVFPSYKPMLNEQITITGLLNSSVQRTVWLQFLSNGEWKTSGTTTSSPTYFAFQRTAKKSSTYRYYVPRQKIAGKIYPTIVGNPKVTKIVAQSVSLKIAYNDCSMKNDVTVFAEFYPIRPNRDVTIQLPAGPVNFQQDDRGRAGLTFDPGNVLGSYSVKAIAQAYNGAAAKSSSPVGYTVPFCP